MLRVSKYKEILSGEYVNDALFLQQCFTDSCKLFLVHKTTYLPVQKESKDTLEIYKLL